MRRSTTRAAAMATAILGVAGLALGASALADDDAADPPPAWERVTVLPLWKAVKRGEVAASGSRPRGYSQIEVEVRNETRERVAVDLAGSYLRPRQRGSCQRLGLGPPVTAESTDESDDATGTVVLQLEPGAKRTVLMNSCCLDASRSAPSTHEFDASPEPLPPVRETVLRWWAANPHVPQYAVNSAIWRNRRTVVVPDGVAETGPMRLRYRVAAAHGGIYYQLKDSVLTSLDDEGVRRVHGSQIELVFPIGDTVYAVMPGDDHEPDLWRLAPTGENPWGFVADLDPDAELLDVLPLGGRGDLVLLDSLAVRRFDAEAKATTTLIELETSDHLSGRVGTKSGDVYVTRFEPRVEGVTRQSGEVEGEQAETLEVWRIDRGTGTAERTEHFWNVRTLRAGPGGIYGLSHRGVLRRVSGGKVKDVGPGTIYRSLVAVGTRVIWAIDDRGRLVGVDRESGRTRFVSDAEVGKDDRTIRLDPVTDDLVFVASKRFHRVRAKDGVTTPIPETRDED